MSITLTYGGLIFKEVSIRGHHRAPRLHGPDYLYNQGELHVRALYNPAMNDNKDFWYLTDKVRIPKELEPRQDLTVQVGTDDWLSIKAPDLDLGPHALYCNVHQVVGKRSAWLDLGFRYAHRDVGAGDLPTILSNKWSVASETSNRFWNSRVITGEVVFNGQSKKLASAFADLHKAILLPVPNRYKRESLSTSISDDGLVCRYSFVDRQVPYCMLPAYVADADVVVSGVAARISDTDVIMGSAALGMDMISAGMGGVQEYSRINTLGGASNPQQAAHNKSMSLVSAGAGAVKDATQLVGKAAGLILGIVPTVSLQVASTVYGLPHADMDDLLTVAEALVLTRIAALPGLQDAINDLSLANASLSCSARERTAHYSVTVSREAVATVIKAALKSFNAAQVLLTLRSEDIVTTLESYANAMTGAAMDNIEGISSRTTSKPQGEGQIGGFAGDDSPEAMVIAALYKGDKSQDEKVLLLE